MELIVHRGDLEGLPDVIGVAHLRDRRAVNVSTGVYVLLVERKRPEDTELPTDDEAVVSKLLDDRLLERRLKSSDFDTRWTFYLDLHVEGRLIDA